MRLFKRRAVPQAPDADFLQFLAEYGLVAFDHQLRLSEVVGDRDWQLDQDRGVLRFGDDIVLDAQILGSSSDRSQTWLWAWANPSVGDELTREARRARELGAASAASVFTAPEFPISRVGDDHALALCAAGLLGADAYYRCPYPGGAAIVVVDCAQVHAQRSEADVPSLLLEAVQAIPDAVSRVSIARYLDTNAITFAPADDGITLGNGTSLRFDSAGRLVEIASSDG